MSDDKLEVLAGVLREFIAEVGCRHLLPHQDILDWSKRIDQAFPRYVCGGCDQPIVTGQAMVGSDLISFYAHKACEATARGRWKESHPAPEGLESEPGGRDGETQEADTRQGE